MDHNQSSLPGSVNRVERRRVVGVAFWIAGTTRINDGKSRTSESAWRTNESISRQIFLPIVIFAVLSFALVNEPSAQAEVQFGPEVSVSLPQTLQLGVEGYCTEGAFYCMEKLRGYVDMGGLIYPLAVSERSLSVFNLETGVRYFPSSVPFLFAGFALGLRNIGIKADMSAFHIDGAAIASSGTISLSTVYVGPLVGIKFSLGNGFLLEANAGIQLALYASGSMYLMNGETGANSNNSESLQVDSQVAMSRIAGILLPSVTVVRLIRYF